MLFFFKSFYFELNYKHKDIWIMISLEFIDCETQSS